MHIRQLVWFVIALQECFIIRKMIDYWDIELQKMQKIIKKALN